MLLLSRCVVLVDSGREPEDRSSYHVRSREDVAGSPSRSVLIGGCTGSTRRFRGSGVPVLLRFADLEAVCSLGYFPPSRSGHFSPLKMCNEHVNSAGVGERSLYT